MKKPITCPKCQRVHGADATVAVGRFNPFGPVGYVAKDLHGALIRITREDAETDYCQHYRGDNA